MWNTRLLRLGKTQGIQALLALLLITGGSCRKEDTNPEVSVFIFGTAFGECAGNCAHFFCLTDQTLYPDMMDYWTGNYWFGTQPLSTEKASLARELKDMFPDWLLNQPDTTYGCPDCHDQGGIHVQVLANGLVRNWHIDTDVAMQPQEIRPFCEKLLQVVDQLETISITSAP